MYKLLSRKLLGERYRSVLKAVFAAFVMGMGLKETGFHVNMAQKVLVITILFMAGTITYQVLNSKDNARTLKGFFAMPCDEKKTLWEYAAVIGLYVLATKVIILAGLLYAFTDLGVMDAVTIFVSFLYMLFSFMTSFALRKKFPAALLLFAGVGVAAAFLLPEGIITVAALGAAAVIAAVIFSFMKIDDFRVSEEKSIKSHRTGSRKITSPGLLIPKYIMRYLATNKSVFISTVFMIAFGVFFAINSEQAGVSFGCGISLCLIVLSSPMATVVSSNRNLKQRLDSMPNKTASFFVPYAITLFFIYMVSYAIFFTAYFAIRGGIVTRAMFIAPLLAAQQAAGNAFLEDKFTLTKWKAEPDLWHHPRKYIIPAILLLESTLLFMI